MLGRLLLLFVTVPIVELALLVWIGERLGFWPTLALVLVTGFVGALLARAAGVRVIQQIRGELAAGRMPVDHMLDGVLVLVGGVVLLTPGLLTDLFGLTLLFPPTRAVVKRFVQKRLQRLVDERRVQVVGFTGGRHIEVDPDR